MLSDLRIRLQSLFRRKLAEDDLNEELRFHIARQTEKYIQSGMRPEEAARRARIGLGGLEQTKEEHRDARGIRFLEDTWRDACYAARMLRKSPGFAIFAILTLALGIGANTAVFGIINSTLFYPFGYPHANRIAFATATNQRTGHASLLDVTFEAWEKQNQSFQAISAYTLGQATLTGIGYPQRLQAALVTSGFFRVLEVQPALGRAFLSSGTRLGGPAPVILSHRLWVSEFDSNSSVIGKTIQLNDNTHTIVGVMPAGFNFPAQTEPDVLLPLKLSEAPIAGRKQFEIIQGTLGLLKPGITMAKAQADLEVILQQQARETAGGPRSFGTYLAQFHASVVPLRNRLVGNTRPAMLVFWGAAFFLLLVACVNVANLALARALAREREIAVRVAVGAHRWRVARQLLTENMLLAGIGALAGIAFALGALLLVRDLGPASISRLRQVSLDLPVLAFTTLIAALAGMLAGLAPMRAVWRLSTSDALKQGERSSSGRGHRRLRSGLMVAEIAMALVLAIGSGLLVRSFLRITSLNLGFNPHNVLTAEIFLPLAKYASPAERSQFTDALLQRVEHLPGVVSAGAGDAAPMVGSMAHVALQIAGEPRARGERPEAAMVEVSPSYFRTMQIPLIEGHEFQPTAPASGVSVAVVVNEAFVRRYFPNRDPLGQKLGPAWTVAGVVGDVHQAGLLGPPAPVLYVPYAKRAIAFLSLVIRTDEDPDAIVPALRAQVEELDNSLPVFNVATMEQRLGKMEATHRFETVVLGLFALLALALAAIGVYGVIAYSVTERTREIGIRMALGAEKASVMRMVVGKTFALALAGVAIGVAAALTLTHFLQSLLFHIRPDDPWTFASAAVLLLGTALLASALPARRAAGVDLVTTLRHE